MKKFALLGEHLSHSYSPLIHNKLFKLKNLNCKYELLECNSSELEMILNKLREGEYSGYNVTIPYKKEVMKYLDKISDEALFIGSVNTIKLEEDKLVGYNTDYFGFMYELEYFGVNVENKNCYVLGTGGASLAIVKVLKDLNANVISVSRTKSDNTITYEELNNINSEDIIINTTPLGMYPNINDSPLSKDITSKAKCVVDIIFNPSTTKLMSYNKVSYNGLMMLVAQADKAEDIWFNQTNQIDLNEVLEYTKEVIKGE